jgi:hypothetical protein
MVMIGIIVCNKIIMYSSFNLQVVYNQPFRQRENHESQSRDYHHLLFPVQLDAARQLDGAGAAA